MRYLCIDLGEKRTGVAVGDDVTRVVSPISTLAVSRDDLLTSLTRLVREHEPGTLILGLPLNMDGTENEATRHVRAFGEQLARATDLPVHFQDERLTSYAADQRMARSYRTRGQKKAIRDALAAAEILRDYLESRASGRPERGE